MGLGAVLNASVSGLRITQAGMDVVAQNIANANSDGYTRRRLVQVQENSGDRTTGARNEGINRTLDLLVLRQVRSETSGSGYTQTMAEFQSALDRLFGPPGSPSALDGTVNAFTQSLQGLVNDPSSYTQRTSVLEKAGTLATTLNGLSRDIQAMRGQAESAIASIVDRTNALLTQIGELNARIVSGGETPSAGLLDERDRAINELSQYMDIRVTDSVTSGVTITTTGGLALFDGSTPLRLRFDEHANISADALYSTDPAKRGVGTIALSTGTNTTIDVLADKMIRSGELAALVELRDKTLVQAQAQLDALAAALSSALSDRKAPTTAVTVGVQTGFDVDMSALPASGNAMTFSYRDVATGQDRTVKVVRVEDASQLPLMNDGSADQVIGMSFAGAPASIVGALNTAFGPTLAFSSVGSTLRVLDNGATSTMGTADVRITNTALTGSGTELPLFYDVGNAQVFTGSFDGGSKTTGFAGRIAVNPALVADRSRLVVYQTVPSATPQGDQTRPRQLLEALTNSSRSFATTTGLGGTGGPFRASVTNFAQRIVENRGAAASSAAQLHEGQTVALKSIEERFDERAGVNIDSEMAQLTQLQNAYAANARVFTAAKEMFDLLFRM
ncbi:MAG: flagellar hook-associated protein FlgK [Beijerinckiaceae bacterium]